MIATLFLAGFAQAQLHFTDSNTTQYPIPGGYYGGIGEQQVTCMSFNFGDNTCQVMGTIIDARIVSILSNAICVQNDSWGYNANYIWVRHGCAANFAVRTNAGVPGGYYPPRPPLPPPGGYYPPRPPLPPPGGYYPPPPPPPGGYYPPRPPLPPPGGYYPPPRPPGHYPPGGGYGRQYTVGGEFNEISNDNYVRTAWCNPGDILLSGNCPGLYDRNWAPSNGKDVRGNQEGWKCNNHRKNINLYEATAVCQSRY